MEFARRVWIPAFAGMTGWRVSQPTIDAKLQSAQALRQSILKHAFTGKLVPQDPDDEPASELLKRIAAERKARVQEAAAKQKRAASRRGRK